MNHNLQIHHVGIVVSSIETWLEGSFYGETSLVVVDPVQDARICFVRTGSPTLLELIQPLGQKSATMGFLRKGGGYHHVCYQARNLAHTEVLIEEASMLRILGPVPATVFSGAQVLFCYSRNREIVEFVLWDDGEPPIDWGSE